MVLLKNENENDKQLKKKDKTVILYERENIKSDQIKEKMKYYKSTN